MSGAETSFGAEIFRFNYKYKFSTTMKNSDVVTSFFLFRVLLNIHYSLSGDLNIGFGNIKGP